MKQTIYIIDRANQFHEESYETLLDADNASDRWEAGGHDVYHDRTRALRAWDHYTRFLRNQRTPFTYTCK